MKKIICLLLCLLFVGIFSACEDPVSDLGTEKDSESSAVTDSADTQESATETEKNSENDEDDGWTNIY